MYFRLCPALLFILYIIARGDTHYDYLGCYLDEHPARRLIGDFKDFGKYLTHKACIDYCKDKGFLYAGVQSSTQCFCGDWTPTYDDARTETECNYKCSGNQSLICGGDWRNSIYKTGITVKNSSNYVGCYVDDPGRRLSGFFKDFGKDLTQQKCINYCKEGGYTYAGVQSSTQCFCGDRRPTFDDMRPETDCNSKCSGDQSLICGGNWTNSIFSTDVRVENRPDYLGCYLDTGARRLSGIYKDQWGDMTQQKCIDFCKERGYVYAGVQASGQCFCGDRRPTYEDSRPENECNSKCSGDQSQICGGDWRNSIFTTNIIVETGFSYVGCYFDDNRRRLSGNFKDFGSDLTQQNCIDYCKEGGYTYAGVQSSAQCFCGDRKPTYQESRPETECNSKCSGDQSLICGGDWRNSIYKTGVRVEDTSSYLGCYFDEYPGRRLSGTFKDFGRHLTQQNCIDYCKEEGYTYAGAQASSQCFCGDRSPTDHDSRPETECNSMCSGDQSLKCGGAWRNSIYKTGVRVKNRSDYMGCYLDSGGRRLSGIYNDQWNDMTQQKCIDYCKEGGYAYAGVQASGQCFCGDRRPTYQDLRPETECNSKCSGDQSQMCGGDWRNSIFKTNVIVENRSNYLGCYFDATDRRLPDNFQDFGKGLTQQKCIDHCKERGYSYAGVQSSTQCFCGDKRPNFSDLRPETECNSKCSGDQSIICGGDWRNSIFRTGIRVEDNSNYVGCYFDAPRRRLSGFFKDFGQDHTQQKCIDYCKEGGYTYAGVQASTQCFCGDQRSTFHDARPETECNYKCTGDQSLICGGDWRNSIYKTGVRVENNSNYVGCYFDSPGRRLSGFFKDFGQDHTQQKCIDYCKEGGYTYAGVQASTQCFCGDQRPTFYDVRPETECNYKCTGDQSLICGGDWRNSIFKTGVRVESNSNYVGCYFDAPERRLSGFFKDFGSDLTQQKCIDYCKEGGYTYAGVQASTQCFCGDQRPTLNDSRPETECDSKCSGDDSLICGGAWRNSVFKTRVRVENSSNYVGCYFDDWNRRLSGFFKDFGNAHTQQKCIDYCKEGGYTYAGVQASTQCFCGDRRPAYRDSRPETECNSKCTGDRSLICGGDWRNSIFKTGVKVKNSSNYMGCYFDDHGRRLSGFFKHFGKDLTQQNCIDYCKEGGYTYAGVQASTQCFCGDRKPTYHDARPETDCNYKCSGDQSLICGGDWRNSIFKTGVRVEDSSSYLGCYLDDRQRRLSGTFQDFGRHLTQQKCIDYCKEEGYTYAGVQSSTQCFCGNQRPVYHDAKPETECNYTCSGDNSLICGGDWRNSIYKTGVRVENSSIYLGCYFDDWGRRLSGSFQDFGKHHTQQKCIDYCKGGGYTYAGVQSSTQCFCGDWKPPLHDARPETECNYKCTGDQSLICGGDWRNSIFKTSVIGSPIIDRRHEYVGCFVDQEPRSLSGDIINLGDTNSPKNCIAFCKRKGYVYAGMQIGPECYCGDEHPSKRADEKDCKHKCTGDKRFNCGSNWRNSVYKTGNSDSLVRDSRYQYLGCYVDESKDLQGYSEDIGNQNSPEKCVTSCKEKGYIYASLQDTTKCFCGDQDPKPEKKVDSKECKFKCPGDYKYTCGGDWRNTVYKTGHSGASVGLTGYEYLGCYKDQADPRLLHGEKLDYPETLTPSLCVGVCQKRGYVYAGLQSSSHCLCGDNEVTDNYKANEEECHMKCTGDRTTFCGGVWRLTIYKTGNKAPSIAKLAANEYVGCYRDHADSKLLEGHVQDFPETLTPKLCVALCKRKGYIYAGLQASSKCICGDEELPTSAKIDDSNCSAKCTGDRSVFCGGEWRNTVYKTGNSGKCGSSVGNIGYLYMGCYRDISFPRKLSGFIADYPDTLTPQHCVTVCKQKGFQFTGLQHGFQCLCGNEFPSVLDKMPESECNSKCSGNLTSICGGDWRNTIYSTARSDDNKIENVCVTSVTRVNGKAACHNEVVFMDNFDTLSSEKWSHTVQIAANPDYEFVIYKDNPANTYIEDGKLIIKPTLLPNTEVRSGDLLLKNCTGNPDNNECGYKARSYAILPPVQSARLVTSKSFSFQYGKVEIRAKLPAGDWLAPEIWLEPKNEVYGPGYASGKINIAMSRGNSDLKLNTKEIGSKHLECGIIMGVGNDIRSRTIVRETADGWHNTYHNYSVIWTPENILFTVDEEQSYYLFNNAGQTLSDVIGFAPDVTPVWSSASKIAPFDNEFYVSLGVTAGGVRNFPDNTINNGKPKPWKNLEVKAMLNFWRDKHSWQSTWHDDTALLQVDYIKVTAL